MCNLKRGLDVAKIAITHPQSPPRSEASLQRGQSDPAGCQVDGFQDGLVTDGTDVKWSYLIDLFCLI